MDPVLLSSYTSFLEQTLTLSRLQHSYGVMQVMGELAGVYSLDPDLALAAGLLHDAGKDLSPVEQQRVIREAGLQIEIADELDYVLYLHGPVGAGLVRLELGVTDTLLLDAIGMHSFWGDGPRFHSPLLWCLRFADVLEPNRDWNDVRSFREGEARLRAAVWAGNWEEGAFLHSSYIIEMFNDKGLPIHPNIHRSYREMAQRLNLNAAFLG